MGWFLAFIFASFFYFYLGLSALKENPRSQLNRIFFLLSLSFGIWAFFYGFLFIEQDKKALWFWHRLSSLGFCTFGGISLHFLMLVVRKRITFLHLLFLYIPSLLFLFQAWNGVITAKDFIRSPLGWVEVLAKDSPWFILFTFYYSFCVIVGLSFLFQWTRRTKKKRERKQGYIILLTGGISFILGSSINIILPLLKIYLLPSLAPFVTLIWAIGSFIALSKYKLFSIGPSFAAEKIIEGMKDILIITDENRLIERVNRAFQDLLGYKEEIVKGKRLQDILEIKEEEWPKEEVSVEKEIDLPDREGNKIPFRVVLGSLSDENSEILGYVIVGHDIRAEKALLRNKEELEEKVKERVFELKRLNEELLLEIKERKRLEEELKESEERYRILIENVRDGVALVRGTEWVYMNDQFAKIFGYETREELLEKPFDVIVDEEFRVKLRDIVLQTERNICGEYELLGLKKDGTRINVELVATGILYKGERHCLIYIRDITEKKRKEEKLRYIGFHDPLTGLYNRYYFQEEMNRLEDGRFDPIGIIIGDLDGLKFINDTLGHKMGDNFIKTAGEIIKGSFRKSDIIARIGGDEFAILLPQSPSQKLERLVARINESMQKVNKERGGIPISLSLGWAVRNDPDKSLEEALKEADDMMYKQKLFHAPLARSLYIEAFKREMRRRDFDEFGHLDRCLKICSSFSIFLSLSKEELERIKMLAVYHDIGKVGVDEKILFKEGPLTEEEIKEFERHCEIGYRIAKNSEELYPVAELILTHHESWDGKGYPLRLKGEDIALECRIFSIVEAYEEMTAQRPNRKAFEKDKALEKIKSLSGGRFDPSLTGKFLEFAKAYEL